MNILSEIEGLKGENLTSAMLRLLLLRSQEVRTALLRLIASRGRIGPFASSAHFSCYAEHPTSAVDGSRGRLDLVVELDGVVVGIENKLHAAFQPGQPTKYLDDIQALARDLQAARRGSEYRSLLALIVPESRKRETEDKTTSDRCYAVVTWEEVLHELDQVDDRLDPLTLSLSRMLVEYLGDSIAFLPRFAEMCPHLRHWEPYGSRLQRDMVGRLWDQVPEQATRLGAGATWCGYWFCQQKFGEHSAWFGFVPRESLRAGARFDAELVVITSFPLHGIEATQALVPVELVNPGWLYGRPQFAHRVNFDESFDSAAKWRALFEPVRQAAERHRAGTGPVPVAEAGPAPSQ